jgi:hypothetical protein
MSTDQSAGDSAAYVQLFQKAHQRIVMLERLDEQVQQILTKRQELQDELRSIQSQLNEEFDSRIKATEQVETPSRPVVTIASDARRGANGRFAGQTIESVTQIP